MDVEAHEAEYGPVEERVFVPLNTGDLVGRALPWIGKLVHVSGWHENHVMRDTFPDDELVGFVVEFSANVPKSELLVPGSRFGDRRPAHDAVFENLHAKR